MRMKSLILYPLFFFYFLSLFFLGGKMARSRSAQEMIPPVLESPETRILNPPAGCIVYWEKVSDGSLALKAGNIQSIPVEVGSVSYNGSSSFEPEQPTILPPKEAGKQILYQIVRFKIPENLALPDTPVPGLKFHYRLAGTERERIEEVYPFALLVPGLIEDDLIRNSPDIEQFDFLLIDPPGKSISVKPGQWDLDRNLVIPGGYQFLCEKGTTLNLSNRAKILSYSPLGFKGTEEEPVLIQSKDGTGQGIAVIQANGLSTLEHVVFDGLSNPSQAGWELTGAVNFYESPVHILHCQFLNSRAEDALNTVRSEFKIFQTSFRQTSSDAFDADFCEGEVAYSTFKNCTNDAIDVSGSTVSLHHLVISGTGDKGISVGEQSQAAAEHIEIENAFIAVASKDKSSCQIDDVGIKNSRFGLVAYQKKPEFGPGLISAGSVRFEKTATPYLIERNSVLQLEKKPVLSDSERVFETLYGK